MVHRSLLLYHRYLFTIQLLDFLSAIQVTIQLTNHLAIRHDLTIWLPDTSGNRMSTVLSIRQLGTISIKIPDTVCRYPLFFSPNGRHLTLNQGIKLSLEPLHLYCLIFGSEIFTFLCTQDTLMLFQQTNILSQFQKCFFFSFSVETK